MKIISLFNGEERQSVTVSDIDDVRAMSVQMAMGHGWGQYLVGAEDELLAIGAEATTCGYLLSLSEGRYLCCEVAS